MADESQEVVFETEEARQAAIDALEVTPENEGKIDALMNAPIKAKEEVVDNPTNQEPEIKTEPDKVEETTEKSVAIQSDEVYQIKKSELPEGFDSPGKLLKSYKSAQETIERQTKFIKEKLGGSDQNLQSAMTRAEKAERELEELRKKIEKPAQQETRSEGLKEIPESNSQKIRALRQQIQELAKDPIANEDAITSKRFELDDLWIAENDRTGILIERANKRAEAAEAKAREVESVATGYVTKAQQTEKQIKDAENLKNEFKSIDEFASDPEYPEFKMSKSAKEIDKEYTDWASEITRLFYGSPVDIFTKKGEEMMLNALFMLGKNAPTLIERCQVSGVPVKPSEDVQKYLDICELLNYRDGVRIDPVTGKKEVAERYHAPSGKMVPDVFPSAKAAYENRKLVDGVYAQKIRESYIEGGKKMAEAASRTDAGTVEMGTATSVSRKDAGLEMTAAEAQNILDTIDVQKAKWKLEDGDPSDFNKLQEAFKILGIPTE